MNVTSAALLGGQITAIDRLQRHATVWLALERPRFPRTNRRTIRVDDASIVTSIFCGDIFAFDLKGDFHTCARHARPMPQSIRRDGGLQIRVVQVFVSGIGAAD